MYSLQLIVLEPAAYKQLNLYLQTWTRLTGLGMRTSPAGLTPVLCHQRVTKEADSGKTTNLVTINMPW
jgi:hypothetical protein